MTADRRSSLISGESKVKRLLAIGATALIASVALASPALAGVDPGRLLEVNYTDDFVLLEGYPNGEVTVDVLRGATNIGTFTGTVEAGLLEINHAGPELDPVTDEVIGTGDCWQGGETPNVRPGDKVQVSINGAVEDYTFVRNLDFEDVNGRLMGVATGNETAPDTFVNTPISLNADPGVDGALIDMRRVGGDRAAMAPGAISPTSGAFDVALGGGAGEVTLQYLNMTAQGGEESTVAGPFDAVAPDLGCGNIVNDPNPNSFADVTPPDAPSIPDLAAASDTGPSNTDNLTTDTTPTFTGSAESRSKVEIRVDGNLVNTVTTVAGAYSFTPASGLSVGQHTVTAKAIDTANNPGAESAALSFEIQALPVPPPPGGGGTPPPGGGGTPGPIVGGSGNDVLKGTPGNDVFIGGGGNDTIIGGGGNDTIIGGPGKDTLKGGAGNDILNGGTGMDRLFGEAGNDRLIGRDGAPRDLLNGGTGRDTATSDRGDVRKSLP